MTCKSGWYETVFYPGEMFSVTQPKKLVDCYHACQNATTTESPTTGSAADQMQFLLSITMILGLLFLLLVAARSCSKVKLDWYRLVAVYILGTLGVPLSLALGPSQSGFNRIAGFGILVHNLAELFLLNHIWLGSINKRKDADRYVSIGAVLYVWFMMVLIVFLPQTSLFLILMIQGATWDWTLVFTFIYMRVWIKHNQAKTNFKQLGCFAGLGVAAAVMHILSIQPLFFAFSTSFGVLAGITVVFLMPTFILYLFFASADLSQPPVIISRNVTSNAVMDAKANKYLKLLIREVRANGKLQHINGNEVDLKEKEEPLLNDKKEVTYETIISEGLLRLGSSKWMKIAFAAGFAIAVVNSLLVFLAPCYVDVTNVISECP